MDRFALILNAGSSSVKYALFEVSAAVKPIDRGSIDHSSDDHGALLEEVRARIAGKLGASGLAAVGHRVVHGGPKYFGPELITAAVLETLRGLGPLDPEHLPTEIDLIEAAQAAFPGIPHVACFDTAFHRDLPRVARILPIPRQYQAEGVRRYGFHGLSCQFLIQELSRLGDPAARSGRVILAHLGSGASLTAVQSGASFDTSMGFTPAAGLVMSKRTGDLDPGLASYFARTAQMSPAQFQQMVNQRSGLLGVSGVSGDLRELLAQEDSRPEAADAVGLFCYQVKKWLGAYAAALGGLDTLVFAGGIGEHMAPIRQRICAGLDFIGLCLDPAANAASEPLISAATSRVAVRVIRTDEEIVIAQATLPFLS